MFKVDLEKERKILDRYITFFHFKRAKRKIEKCLRLSKKLKDDFFFYYFSAQRFILKENFKEAISLFDKALKIRINDGCSYNDKAICLAELGKYREALECFNEGIRRDKDCASLYHNKGWLLNFLGRYREAILCFKKALELEEDRVESMYSLADTYFHLKDKKMAKKYFKKALFHIKGKSSYIYKETLKRLKELKG
jgi:tetratricopeptide (TPR) repeat protein